MSLTYDLSRTIVFNMVEFSRSKRDVPLPTEAELAILNILWATGPSTVREVHTALSSKQTGYTTVLKQMQVMAEKGLLMRSERFRSHVYEVRFKKEQTQKLLARNLLERAFDGSTKNLVLGALSSQKVSPSELAEIRRMLDAFEKGSR
jgi:predicted transcriptional regulator